MRRQVSRSVGVCRYATAASRSCALTVHVVTRSTAAHPRTTVAQRRDRVCGGHAREPFGPGVRRVLQPALHVHTDTTHHQ